MTVLTHTDDGYFDIWILLGYLTETVHLKEDCRNYSKVTSGQMLQSPLTKT